MTIRLRTGQNWGRTIEQNTDAVVEEIVRELTRNNPELLKGKTPDRQDMANIETLIRSKVYDNTKLHLNEKDRVFKDLMGQATGYGELQEFFTGALKVDLNNFVDIDADERRLLKLDDFANFTEIDAIEVTEVMINPAPENQRPKVFFGLHGRPYYAGDHYFPNSEAVKIYGQRIASNAGRTFVKDDPMIDAWLPDGSRASIFGYDSTPFGTAITIRKNPLIRPSLTLEAMSLNSGFPVLVRDMLVDLIIPGYAKWASLGRTDSGKTTLVKAAGYHFDPRKRLMIGETSFELSFPNLPNCINLTEVVIGDTRLVDMSKICMVFLRSNPDRVIIGEIRGGEIVASSEIASATAGGFITTLHAGSVNELRRRFPKMYARGGMTLPTSEVDSEIATMFDFLFFFDKGRDGKRTLMSMVEVVEDDLGQIHHEIILRFDEQAFSQSNGKVRRWIYEKPISKKRLERMDFRGAKNIDTYAELPKNKFLYDLRVEKEGEGAA